MNMQNHKFREWLRIQIVKNPSRVILAGIIVINFLFMCLSAVLVSWFAPSYVAQRGFWSSLFYTVSMVMDAGSMSYVIEDLGKVNAAIVIICVVIALIGMVFFTGGIIGYVSNRISSFIDNSNAGKRPLNISDHTIILNWNSRASEVVNDLLYSEHKEVVVVLVNDRKEEVESEIDNRLADTIMREQAEVYEACRNMSLLRSFIYRYKHNFRSRLTVIVRQGDTFSNKQLMDVSVDKAKTVIILNRDRVNAICNYANDILIKEGQKGNSVTVKTLVLVAEITAAESSKDNQKIIVEVEDRWTEDIVDKIISHKENLGKCNIVPIKVNKVLGQLLSQFSIMPELNLVYSELFSNRGAEFFSMPFSGEEGVDYCREYLKNHLHAVPLTSLITKSGPQFFYMAGLESDLGIISDVSESDYDVKGNPDLWQPRRNVLVMGHNSKISSLMDGFQSYRNEWNPATDGRDILNVFVIDDKNGLERIDYYRDYSYVNQVIEAELYDQELIYDTINNFIDQQDGDTGILILSDDAVPTEDLDASALTYLIYVQDLLTKRRNEHGGKDTEQIDVVIEILNPKNYDVVRSYSVNNVVISNRYVSKMITQIGEKDALFEFYNDILTYDECHAVDYVSKELYIKRVGDVFLKLPAPCTAAELIRAVYLDNKRMSGGNENTTLVLGYINSAGKMTIFSGNQEEISVHLQANDKLILFSNH